jgi:membrane associated rhomboid family serine protease
MSDRGGQSAQVMALPKPGRALWGILLVLFGVWLMFAMALNWGGADPALFELFVGNSQSILSGQLWRLLTAPLIHMPNDPWHVVGVMIGLYFMAPALEARWGGRRLVVFLWASAVLAYLCQMLAEWVLPGSVASKLSMGYWFGGVPVIEATAVAWALHFRGQTVRLFFVLPVTTRGLLLFVIGFSVLRLIAVQQTPEGLISPFGGLAAGWFLGGGTPSPARRLYLKFRYTQLQRETERVRKERARRVKQAPFSVIKGGQGRRDDDDDDGPGGQYLN